jgi:uncharacterized protein (TIGR02117 family)
MLLSLIAGCPAALTEAANATECETPRTVYVVSHGWHTGLVVDRRDLMDRVPQLGTDFGKVKYLEVGWGDQRFYQAETVKFGLALRAVLFPTSSVLHIVEVPDSPRHYFSGSEVVEVSVPQTGYGKLLDFVAGSFIRTSSNDVMKLGRGIYGESRFYRAEGRFHAFNTCNTWVAKAIGATGYPISKGTITVRGLMSQLDPSSKVETNCYSIR